MLIWPLRYQNVGTIRLLQDWWAKWWFWPSACRSLSACYLHPSWVSPHTVYRSADLRTTPSSTCHMCTTAHLLQNVPLWMHTVIPWAVASKSTNTPSASSAAGMLTFNIAILAISNLLTTQSVESTRHKNIKAKAAVLQLVIKKTCQVLVGLYRVWGVWTYRRWCQQWPALWWRPCKSMQLENMNRGLAWLT